MFGNSKLINRSIFIIPHDSFRTVERDQEETFESSSYNNSVCCEFILKKIYLLAARNSVSPEGNDQKLKIKAVDDKAKVLCSSAVSNLYRLFCFDYTPQC
jgi:hypothetical protein